MSVALGPARERITAPAIACSDECDQADCPAPAQTVIELRTGQLGFCGHHAQAVMPALLASGLDFSARRIGRKP